MFISSLTKDNLSTVFELSNSVFGENYLPLLHYKSFIKSELNDAYLAIVNEQVVGFITLSQVSQKQLNKLIRNQIDDISINEKITLIQQIAVTPNFRKKGVASELINKCLHNTNHHKKICIAWERNKTIALHNILINNNFKKVMTLKRYWYEDSISKKYQCLDCGTPCKCNAAIYLLD